MSSSEFLQIAAYANAAEAEYVRSVLEENDVPAFIDGAAANTALSHVGVALGGVKVLVRASDEQQARAILDRVGRAVDLSADPWFCGACGESVEGGFEVCWSCGKPRSEVEAPFPIPAEGDPLASGDEGDHGEDDGRLPETPSYDDANPYASPKSAETPAAPAEPPAGIDEEAEAMLVRAWRAAILGTVFLPLVLHVYSAYLLIRAASTTARFSPQGEKRFRLALAVDLVAGPAWAVFFGYMA